MPVVPQKARLQAGAPRLRMPSAYPAWPRLTSEGLCLPVGSRRMLSDKISLRFPVSSGIVAPSRRLHRDATGVPAVSVGRSIAGHGLQVHAVHRKYRPLW